MTKPPDTLEAGRSGPWCETGSRTYTGKPFDRKELIRKAANTRLSIRVCPLADDSHEKSLRQYAHTWHDHKKPGQICVSQAFLELPRETRDGLIAHEIGHILAGPTSSEPAADEAFRVFSGIRILYRDSEHGSCLQWLPKKFGKLLEGLLQIDLSGLTKTLKRNSDESMRRLEREASSEDYEAQLRVALAKIRAGRGAEEFQVSPLSSVSGTPFGSGVAFRVSPTQAVGALGHWVNSRRVYGVHWLVFRSLHGLAANSRAVVAEARGGAPADAPADHVWTMAHMLAPSSFVPDWVRAEESSSYERAREYAQLEATRLASLPPGDMKKNSDDLLRRLEREARSGDPEAIARLKKEIRGRRSMKKNGRVKKNPLVDSDVLAQQLYDASFSATEIPLSKVNMSTSDRGHPVVDEPERYRWFLIDKFPVQAFGLQLADLMTDSSRDFRVEWMNSHERARHDEILKLLRSAPAWPAILTATGVLIDGYHRITANRTLGRKTMPVIVAVERSGNDLWDDLWIGDEQMKKNGDELLRRLERQAKSGDQEAIERLKKARARHHPTIRELYSEAPVGVSFRFATEVDGVLDERRPLPGPWRKISSDEYRYIGQGRDAAGQTFHVGADGPPDDPEIVWEDDDNNKSHLAQRRAAERRKTSKTTFKKIPIGGIFVFASRYDDAFAMPLGPWEKTSPRGYMRVDPEYYSLPNGGRSKRRVKHEVGTVNVEVYPEDLKENPMKKNGDELLRRMETGRGGFGTWEILRERARRGLSLAPTVLKDQWVRNPWSRFGKVHEDYNAKAAAVVLLPPGVSLDSEKYGRLDGATAIAVMYAHPHKEDAARDAFRRRILVAVTKEVEPDRWHPTELARLLADNASLDEEVRAVAEDIENATRAKLNALSNPPKDPRGLTPGGAGILFMSDDAVFLIQRSRRVPSPGTWCIPGGKIEPGEDPFDAALRETKEEVGEKLPPFEVNERIDVRHDDGFVFSTFVARVRQRDAALWITRLNWECDDSGWFLLNKLPSPLHQGVASLLTTCPDLWTPARRPGR